MAVEEESLIKRAILTGDANRSFSSVCLRLVIKIAGCLNFVFFCEIKNCEQNVNFGID